MDSLMTHHIFKFQEVLGTVAPVATPDLYVTDDRHKLNIVKLSSKLSFFI